MSYQSEVLADSPYAFYRLGGSPTPGAGALVDSSGNGRNGDTAGVVTFGATGAVAGDTAMTLDGASGQGITPTAPATSSDFSVECWIKTTATALVVVWSKGGSQFLCVNSVSGKATFAGTGANCNSSANVCDGTWHHIVVVQDGTTIRMYVDGVADGTSTSTQAATSGGFILGQLGSAFWFPGSVDEFAVYNFKLTPTRIAAHYAAASGGGSSPATSYAVTGPTSGTCGVASSVFTVTPNGTSTATVTISLSTGGSATVTFDGTSSAKTFTITPSSPGTITLTFTNSGSLTNQTPLTYTSLAYTITDTTSADGTAVRFIVPWNYSATVGANLIIYHHGVSGTYADNPSAPYVGPMIDLVLQRGYIVAGSSAAGDNWGNSAGMQTYVSLYAKAVETYRIKKVLAWSGSMGGMSGLLTLIDGRIPYVGWYGTYPVCSLSSMFAANAGAYASSIRAAYGIAADGSDYAAKTAGHDPLLYAASAYPRVGMRFIASYGDTVVSRAANSDALSTLLSQWCPEYTVVNATGNHGDPSHYLDTDFADFFDRCVARRERVVRVG